MSERKCKRDEMEGRGCLSITYLGKRREGAEDCINAFTCLILQWGSIEIVNFLMLYVPCEESTASTFARGTVKQNPTRDNAQSEHKIIPQVRHFTRIGATALSNCNANGRLQFLNAF